MSGYRTLAPEEALGIVEFIVSEAIRLERLRIVAAIETERLLDDTGEESDAAYNRALDDVLALVTQPSPGAAESE